MNTPCGQVQVVTIPSATPEIGRAATNDAPITSEYSLAKAGDIPGEIDAKPIDVGPHADEKLGASEKPTVKAAKAAKTEAGQPPAKQLEPAAPSGPSHAHHGRFLSSAALEHTHWIDLFTYPVNGTAGDRHTHDYQGTSKAAAADGQLHFHRFYGVTGPAIPLPDGRHIHRIKQEMFDEPFQFEGGSYRTVLTIPRHSHSYTGSTGTGIGYEPDSW